MKLNHQTPNRVPEIKLKAVRPAVGRPSTCAFTLTDGRNGLEKLYHLCMREQSINVTWAARERYQYNEVMGGSVIGQQVRRQDSYYYYQHKFISLCSFILSNDKQSNKRSPDKEYAKFIEEKSHEHRGGVKRS